MTYRPAILLGLLAPLLIWQRSANRAPGTIEELPPAPMAATKRPRIAPAAPLHGFADAAARGTRDSLRSWASGLDDEEILDHLQTTLDRIAADGTRPKEELFHLRPLLCALAMEAGRRDIEAFTGSRDSMEAAEIAGNLVYPAIAGHAEIDPAGAWLRLQETQQFEGIPIVGGFGSNGSEIADYIFRLWVRKDPEAAKNALKKYRGELMWWTDSNDQALAALSAIIRVAGPDAAQGLVDVSGTGFTSQCAEIAAALAAHDVAAAQKQSPDAEHSARFIARWTRDDPDAALSYATSLGTQDALLAVATGLFRDDPRRAMDLLYSLNDPEAAKACIGTWKDGDHGDDGAWPVFEGAAPRVSRVTRKDAILIALHRLQQLE